MIPVKFAEANKRLGPPVDMSESQVQTIFAFSGQVVGGSCDGVAFVVTAWKPDDAEIARIVSGAPIYLTCMGGLPPHMLSTSFEEAARPA